MSNYTYTSDVASVTSSTPWDGYTITNINNASSTPLLYRHERTYTVPAGQHFEVHEWSVGSRADCDRAINEMGALRERWYPQPKPKRKPASERTRGRKNNAH